jgi:hypothetical protein
MTAQEQQMIDGLVERIRATSVTDKDLAAEQHLQQGLAGYPDAVYVLAQTVLVQQYGLEQAKAQLQQQQTQIQQLQAQLDAQPAAQQQPAGGGSFLSHLFGGPSAQQPPQTPPYQPVNNPTYAQQPVYTQPAYAQPVYTQPVYTQPGFGMGGSGFLRGAMQTAAGIAAGELAFQGIESLFHGFGGGGDGGGFGGGGYGGGRPEEIVNNYYEDGDRHEEHGREERGHEERGRDNDGFSGGHENRIHDADYIGSDTDMNTDNSDQNYDSGSDDSGSSGDDDMNSF